MAKTTKPADGATSADVERQAAEEAARAEAERHAAEEATRGEAERQAAEEAARVEAERQALQRPVRVLCAVEIGGVPYRPNAVVTGLSDAERKAHAADLDDSPEAVAYVLSGGALPIEHIPTT